MTLPDLVATPSYLVFGATGGIGSELCRHLAAQGARLVIAGRNEEKLRALSEELRGFAYPLDATHFEEVDACVQRALELQTRLDGMGSGDTIPNFGLVADARARMARPWQCD